MKARYKFFLTSLLYSTGVFAHTYTEEKIITKLEHAFGYNAPAGVILNRNPGYPNLSLEASFLYYYAGEDGLDIANGRALVPAGVGEGTVTTTSNIAGLTQDFSYSPAFKIGFGAGIGEWGAKAQYTWIRQTTVTTGSAPKIDPESGSGVWLFNNWFEQKTPGGDRIAGSSVTSDWHLAMDIADLSIGRPFFQAPNLSVSPFFGIRGAWIRQKMNISAAIPTILIPSLRTSPVHSHNSSGSWAVGPHTGLEGSFILGKGLTIKGKSGVSLLFTQYTTVSHSEEVASSLSAAKTINTKLSDINCLRPEFDLGFALDWGMYLSKKQYYIDLSAGYDFILFWSQNMMRKLVDQTVAGTGASPGDLFLHGLNISVNFYF